VALRRQFPTFATFPTLLRVVLGRGFSRREGPSTTLGTTGRVFGIFGTRAGMRVF
jgi:hypothetical protein